MSTWKEPCGCVMSLNKGVISACPSHQFRMEALPAPTTGLFLDRIAALEAQVKALQGERDEAREFGVKAAKAFNELLEDQRVLRCAFCDEQYPPGTPPTQHEALTAHVKVCPKHPMRVPEAQLAVAVEARDRIQRKCEQYWNERAVCDEEFHAILEWIHREAASLAAIKSKEAK